MHIKKKPGSQEVKADLSGCTKEPFTGRMCILLFTHCGMGKICLRLWEICLKEDLVGRACSSQQHQDLRGRLLTRAVCCIHRAANVMWHFTRICCIFPLFSLFIALHFLDKFLRRSDSLLHPALLVKRHTWKQ